MATLKEIKLKIFKTECKNLLYEGLSMSEPILTMGEKGLIDNYFIYASDKKQTVVSKPMIAFGIYSDLEITAYINSDIYNENADPLENIMESDRIDNHYVEEYENLYVEVREFVYQNCSESRKDILRDYIEHLYYLSGSGLWQNYLEIAPDFFDWIKKEEINYNIGGNYNG